MKLKSPAKVLKQPPRCPYRGNASALRASCGVHNSKFTIKRWKTILMNKWIYKLQRDHHWAHPTITWNMKYYIVFHFHWVNFDLCRIDNSHFNFTLRILLKSIFSLRPLQVNLSWSAIKIPTFYVCRVEWNSERSRKNQRKTQTTHGFSTTRRNRQSNNNNNNNRNSNVSKQKQIP